MKHNLLTYREVDSTNAEAARLLKEEPLPGGTVIQADYQSGGRGQGKNRWVSDRGNNLLMSWIVYPAFLSVQDQFQLSKAVAVAITDFLSAHFLSAVVKWPNDILCDGAKICGILIEHAVMGGQLRHSIVGIGLNVYQEAFPSFPWRATSMALEMKRSKGAGDAGLPAAVNNGHGAAGNISGNADVSAAGISNGSLSGIPIDALASRLTAFLEARYAQLAGSNADEISRVYLQRFYRLDELSEYTDGKSRFRGVARGVDDSGQLMLETGSGIKHFGFHELQMVNLPGS
jgi:BirA family biotin operon repressor/biotin-[acetyl-CoA-carboxylase] ligase